MWKVLPPESLNPVIKDLYERKKTCGEIKEKQNSRKINTKKKF